MSIGVNGDGPVNVKIAPSPLTKKDLSLEIRLLNTSKMVVQNLEVIIKSLDASETSHYSTDLWYTKEDMNVDPVCWFYHDLFLVSTKAPGCREIVLFFHMNGKIGAQALTKSAGDAGIDVYGLGVVVALFVDMLGKNEHILRAVCLADLAAFAQLNIDINHFQSFLSVC